MKIAIVRNTPQAEVIERFGRQNKEFYREEDIMTVKQVLTEAGHDVTIVEGDKNLISNLEMLKGSLAAHEFFVFNLAYGVQGESPYTHIPSIFEFVGLPYLGSGPQAQTLCLDKYLSKIMLQNAGLPTPAFQLFRSLETPLADHLHYPLIVKPHSESTSFGLQVVENHQALQQALEYIFREFQQPALVEEFIDGREVNCAILGNDPPRPLPVVEIEFGSKKGIERVLDFTTKHERMVSHICPARLSPALTARIQHLTVQAFQVLGCRDCVRIDYRLDQHDTPYILEVNSMPAIHVQGSYYDAALVAGMNYQNMILNILNAAVTRYFGKRA